MKQFFGKYRGKVASSEDPDRIGRIKVKVPSVLGDKAECWAMPCVPYGGNGVGFFAIPPKDANVWVEFEDGRLDRPVWTGCFWAPGEAPAEPAEPSTKILKTDKFTLVVSDKDASLKIEVRQPAGTLTMTMDSSGIELKNGQQTVKLSQMSVSINSGALEVK